jgi:hypothetical protein
MHGDEKHGTSRRHSTHAHDFSREDNASYNLWTWLLSNAAAQKAHGDHARNFRPAIADVRSEAAEFIAHRLHTTPKERDESGAVYECPCGEPHDDAAASGHDPSAPSGEAPPATFDAFLVEMRSDIERSAKHWQDSNRSNPQQFPLSFPAHDQSAWFEQFLAFVNHGPV